MQTTELQEYNTTKAQRDAFPPIVCVSLDFMHRDWFALKNVDTGLYWKSNIRRGNKKYIVGGWSRYPANCCTRTNQPPP
jgi:hypothetical protein